MKTKVVPASEPDPKKGLRVSDYVDHENPKVKIKLRVLYQGDQFVGLLVPIGAEFGNNLVDMGSKNAIVTCMVLDGDEHMYPMGLRVDRFHKCPTAELEITGLGSRGPFLLPFIECSELLFQLFVCVVEGGYSSACQEPDELSLPDIQQFGCSASRDPPFLAEVREVLAEFVAGRFRHSGQGSRNRGHAP